MDILGIVLLYVGINIDTFITLLFVRGKYTLRTILAGFVISDVLLWVIGVLLGKTLTILFPDWITGLFGFVLLYLAVRRDRQEVSTDGQKTGLMTVLMLCLSLGGDNLAVYIPWSSKMGIGMLALVTVIFIVCSVVATYLVNVIAKFKPFAHFLERYGNYCTRLIYLVAGIRILYSSRVINHLLMLVI